MAKPPKLTDAQVIELRRLRADGWTLAKLSEKFGLSIARVSHVAIGEFRPDLPGVVQRRRRRDRMSPEVRRQEQREANRRYREKKRNDDVFRKKRNDDARRYRARRGEGGWEVPEDATCAICGLPNGQEPTLSRARKPTTRRRLVMDHDHATGGLREPLCRRCNLKLGEVEADPERFAALLRYLVRWQGAGAEHFEQVITVIKKDGASTVEES